MSDTIRTFIAIELNPKIRQTIAQIQSHLKELDCNVKWGKPENIHLTLKFLGEVKPKKIDTIKQALENLSKSTEPINSKLTQLGAFPNIKNPEILWIGLKDDNHHILQLAALLEKELGKVGFKKERKSFNPHITIGRVRSPKNLNLLSETMSNYSLPDNPRQTINCITLFKSTLTQQGPIYEALKIFHFSHVKN